MHFSTAVGMAWLATSCMAAPGLSGHAAVAKRSPQEEPTPTGDTIDGLYTLEPKPITCSDEFIPFETSLSVKSSQMNLHDAANSGSWWGWKEDIERTFSTDTAGVIFGKPSFIQIGSRTATVKDTRTAANAIKLNMSDPANGQTLFWQIFKTDAEDTTSPDSLKLLEDTDKLDSPDDLVFQLKITGKYPCENPVKKGSSCEDNAIERNAETWKELNVDRFFNDWLGKRDTSKPMMQAFQQDFGVGAGSLCSIKSGPCHAIESCTSLKNRGKGENSAQAYLVWLSLQNLSDMFNRVWGALLIGEVSTLAQISEMAIKFDSVHPGKIPGNANPLGVLSGIFGALGGFLAFVPGVAPAGSIARLAGGAGEMIKSGGLVGSGVATMTGGVLTSMSSRTGETTWQWPDNQYAVNQAGISSLLGDYTDGMRTVIEDVYAKLFEEGDGVWKIIENGAMVNRTDLNLDCDGCLPYAQQWMQQYLSLRMINEMWKKQNVFVTYVEYGEVIQVDTRDEKVQFDGKSCHDNFLTGSHQNLTVCLETGMASIAWFNPYDQRQVKKNKNGAGKLLLDGKPPGWDSDLAFNSTGKSNYKFNATDVITSSVKGWLEYGYGDAYEKRTSELSWNAASGNLDKLNEMFFNSPAESGIFNLPICKVKNLNFWPTVWSTSDSRAGGNNLCFCNNFNDRNNRPFTESVNEELAYISQHQLGNNYVQSCDSQESHDEPPWDVANAP